MMTDRKWFLLAEGIVSGPFSKTDIETRVFNMNNPLIWGRGQPDWAPLDRWNKILRDSENSDLKNRNSAGDRMWRLRVSGQESKPMTHDQMIEYLKTLKDYSEIQIWTDGYTEWKDIYQIHKIMDELGVSRRQHPRVPIMGTVMCEGATGNFQARALSISEGGMGITEAGQVKIGEKFKLTLKSPNLYTPIHATADVVYVGGDGYAGLKFVGLQSESKSAVIEYIKKFTDVK